MNEHEIQAQADAQARALLQHIPDISPGANRRVALRLERSRAQRPSSPGWAWAGGGVVLAAAAAVAIWIAPAPKPAFQQPELVSEQVWHTAQSEGVALSFKGTGVVAGESKAPRIEWQRGTLNVEVTPELGVDLRVETREAAVRVLGTGFSVHRDALGTQVDVRHGIVETQCGDGEVHRLEAGGSLLCMPRSPAGLLGRAGRLKEMGADPVSILTTIDRGVALVPDGDPVADELLAMRAETLVDAGRLGEALEVVRESVERGAGVRRSELVALGVRLASGQGGCAQAAPWLVSEASLAGLPCDPM